jgi:hypothetical protein
MLAEAEDGPVGDLDDGDSLSEVQGGFQGVGEASFDAVLSDEPVDDHLDGVLVVPVELDVLGEVPDLTVDAGPTETLSR